MEPEPDASEVQRLAGYGPPPRSAIEAPIYAVRVLLRRLELKRQVISSRKMLADAERASDEKLAAMTVELRLDARWRRKFSRHRINSRSRIRERA